MGDTLHIEPLDAPLGAHVHGLDATAPPDAATRDALVAALDRHLVLLFHHDPPLSDGQVDDLCSAFGPLRPTLADRSRLPGHPGINRVSNRDADGVQGTGGSGKVTWHSDLHFTPPLIEWVYLDALEVPSEGGATAWVNLCAAYDDLGSSTKELVENLGVRYRFRDDIDFAAYFTADDLSDLAGDTEVGLVQVNPRTGRRSIWPNRGPDFTVEVVGMDPDEGAELLHHLFEHCTRERYQYRHPWQPGDAAMWLNTQTMHERDPFPDDEPRVLRHVNILGVTDPRQPAR